MGVEIYLNQAGNEVDDLMIRYIFFHGGDVLVEQMILIKIWICFKSYQFGNSAGEMATFSTRIEETSFQFSSLPSSRSRFSAKLLGGGDRWWWLHMTSEQVVVMLFFFPRGSRF